MDMRITPPYAYKNHSLADHMEACLRLTEKFLENNPSYSNIIRVRLFKSGLGSVDQKSIENLLKLGAAIHDIGKAYRYYQERVEKFNGGFEYHEILSTVSCHKIVFLNIFQLKDRRLGLLLLLAILNHHQAFRESIPVILLDVNMLSGKLLQIVRSGLSDNISSLEHVLNMFGLTIEQTFVNDQRELRAAINSIASMLKSYLKRRFDENRRWLKLYTLFMLPIVLVDNLDAHEKRGGTSNPLLINELKKIMGV